MQKFEKEKKKAKEQGFRTSTSVAERYTSSQCLVQQLTVCRFTQGISHARKL
jgi:hypothetical protein